MIYTFGPAPAAPDAIDAVRHPERWRTPNTEAILLHWWWWHPGAPDRYVGLNKWPAVQPIDFAHYPLPITIGYESIQPGHTDWRVAVDMWNVYIRPAMARQNLHPAAVTFDEPLTHDETRQPPRGFDAVVDATRRVAEAIGLPVWLYEAYPSNSAERLAQFIEAIQPTRFVLDVNEGEFTHSTWQTWEQDVTALRILCEARGIQFAIAGVGQRKHGDPPHTDESYVESALHFTNRAAKLTDYLTIESWGDGENYAVPRTLR